MTVPAVSWGEALKSYTLTAPLPPLPISPATCRLPACPCGRSGVRIAAERCGALRSAAER
jgi:hypothetical protein